MPKTPAYRKRPGYSQALVTLSDKATGQRRDYWLGEYGTPESREVYHRLIAAWERNQRNLPDGDLVPEGVSRRAAPGRASKPDMGPTILEVIRAYWEWAKGYYQPNEYKTLKIVLRLLRKYHGSEPARSFGPVKLRALRQEMIRGGLNETPEREPWSRGYINQQVRRIRQMFKWAASHEMVPSSVHLDLESLEPLKRGRCAARESKTVKPVPAEVVEQTRPFMGRHIRAIVDLQLSTGARGGELVSMRAGDVERRDSDGVWVYRPRTHKTMHRGKSREILLGPRAQEVLRDFLTGLGPDEFVFSPAEALAEFRAAASAARRPPLSCGNRPGKNRVKNPQWTVGEHYTPMSYARAVQRACDLAFPPPEQFGPRVKANGRRETEAEWMQRLTKKERAELEAWRKAHRWHPHQLRHTAATRIRRECGLEAAQLVLGHSFSLVTEAVYAERDQTKIAEVVRRMG